MADDELVGNMDSEKMIGYFQEIGQPLPLNEKALAEKKLPMVETLLPIRNMAPLFYNSTSNYQKALTAALNILLQRKKKTVVRPLDWNTRYWMMKNIPMQKWE